MTEAKGTKPGGLHSKLAAALANVDHVDKGSRNEHHKYDYASAEDILRVCRGPLIEQGLVIVPELTDIEQEGNKTTVHITYHLVDSESGETVSVPWVGEGNDNQDKGVPKAYTSALKFFLRHLFLLPQGEGDVEGDNVETKRPAKKAAVPANGGPPHIPVDRAKSLYERIEASPLQVEDINLVLGSAGVDAVTDVSKQQLGNRLARLTVAQAAVVEGALPEVADV